MQIRFGLITTCLATVISTSAFANSEDRSCYEALTNNNTADSQSFQILEHRLSNQANSAIKLATSAVLQLAEDLGCSTDEPTFEAEKSGCRKLIDNDPSSFSEVCFVHTNLGYFITNVDMFDNVNIIFVRWD